jgi:hypothetical protein
MSYIKKIGCNEGFLSISGIFIIYTCLIPCFYNSLLARIWKKRNLYSSSIGYQKETAATIVAYLSCCCCCFSCSYRDSCYDGGPLFCCLHALASFNTAIQLSAVCSPTVTNPLRTCFCLFTCFVTVLLLSANAGDANVPITTVAAAKTATNARVVWFILLPVCYTIT